MQYCPQIIDWELTSRQTRAKAGDRLELDLDEALAVVSQFESLRVERVNLFGDDTFRYPHWSAVGSALARTGFHTEIITYRPLPENVTAQIIRDSGISRVTFGIDGLAANHDLIHKQPDLFKGILRAIEQIMEVDLPVGVVTMISDKNIGDLPTLLYVIHAAGVANWKLQALISTSPWHHVNGARICDDTFRRLSSFLQLMGPQAEKLGIELELDDSIGYYGDADIRKEPWSGCPGGRTFCAITSTGMVKGCLFLPDAMIEGDLRQRTLPDIWHDTAAFTYARTAQRNEVGPNCADCGQAEECCGGCSAMSFILTGRLHNNPYCFQGIERRG
jgi:radical SAM protein with 4Fe4S-binding SPASM domain